MPKTIYEIKEFSGGLINVADPRDIPENGLHLCNNAVVARTGKIMQMGKEVPHSITEDNQLTTNITAGHGLYLFRTDFNYTRGLVNSIEYGTPGYNYTGSDPTFLEINGTAYIDDAAGSAWFGSNTLQIISTSKHKLTTGSKVSLYCSGEVGYNQQSVPVRVSTDYKFSYITSDSVPGAHLAVNWICDDSYYLSDITDNATILESKPGSFAFIVLQNGNKFHLHSQTSGKFFENVGFIQEATSTGIQPEFIYIDDALRISNGNFTNNAGYIGNLQRAFSPRWFGFIPIREQFVTSEQGASSPGRIINPGWRDEVNNVYDADCILGTSWHGADTAEEANELFVVENGDGSNDGFTTTSDSSISTSGKFDPMRVFMSISTGTSGGNQQGDWQMDAGSDHETLKFGISYIYDEYPYEQESRLFKSTTEIKMDSIAGSTEDDVSLLMEFKAFAKGWPTRIVGFSIYLWFMNHELENPRWIGSAKFDSTGGWTGHDGVHRGWEEGISGDENYTSRIVLTGDYRMRAIPSIFYRYRNGYSHNEDSCTHRFKTAAVVNGKLYAGNVMQVGGVRHGVIFQDRMLVSPVRKFDILSSSSELTTSTSDGDEIIALVGLGHELLQFKRRSLYIISCADATGEQIKSVHKFHGIYSKDAVTKFEGGVIWVNPNGIYVYDGEQIFNLIYQKIDLHFFRACLGPSKTGSIGYLSSKKQIIVYFEQNPYSSDRIDSLYMDMDGDATTGGLSGERSHCLIYDLDTDTWAFGTDKTSSEVKTNMLDDYSDKLMFGIGNGVYNESSSVSVVGDVNAPAIAQGSFKFSGLGSVWNNTYRHLHFYNEEDSAWKYVGACDLGIAGETNLSSNISATQALAAVISDSINRVIDSDTDQYGNATEPAYNAEHINQLIESELDEGDEHTP